MAEKQTKNRPAEAWLDLVKRRAVDECDLPGDILQLRWPDAGTTASGTLEGGRVDALAGSRDLVPQTVLRNRDSHVCRVRREDRIDFAIRQDDRGVALPDIVEPKTRAVSRRQAQQQGHRIPCHHPAQAHHAAYDPGAYADAAAGAERQAPPKRRPGQLHGFQLCAQNRVPQILYPSDGEALPRPAI